MGKVGKNVTVTNAERTEEHAEYYNLEEIKKHKCLYNVIFGKRSNGKTYSVLKEILVNYVKTGKQGAYLRRYREDFVGKRGDQLFQSLVSNGVVKEITGGVWDRVKYNSSRWYLAREEDGRVVSDQTPFCFGFSLSQMEHDKSTSFPDITTIVFDEFISRVGYLNGEFVIFMNVLSTIIRNRDDVIIYMLGNTVNKYCPYFQEMGLGHVENMEEGKIDIYSYGSSKLRVAVERTRNHNIEGRKSDKYFAFDNPSLEMITGGAWELDLYPHLPREYGSENVIFKYFISFNDQLLQAEVLVFDDCSFTYIHRKTGDIKYPDKDLIFETEYDPRPNHVRNIKRTANKVARKLGVYFQDSRVFYQDNDVGEIVRNYLQFCSQDHI